MKKVWWSSFFVMVTQRRVEEKIGRRSEAARAFLVFDFNCYLPIWVQVWYHSYSLLHVSLI